MGSQEVDPDYQWGSQQSYFLPIEQRTRFVRGTRSFIPVEIIPDGRIEDKKDFYRNDSAALNRRRVTSLTEQFAPKLAGTEETKFG